MKKTPADFATAPTVTALQALVAVSALAGLASQSVTPVQAAEGAQTTYNPATQKSVGANGLDLATITTVATQSFYNGNITTDDSKSSSDVF